VDLPEVPAVPLVRTAECGSEEEIAAAAKFTRGA